MRIMIVDDSQTMRRIFTSLLRSENLDVIEAENGIDALEKAMGNRIDRFIVAMNLPGMNGIEFGKNLRTIETFKSTPIVFVITEIPDLLKKEVEQIGAVGWLNKPFDRKDFLSCLQLSE